MTKLLKVVFLLLLILLLLLYLSLKDNSEKVIKIQPITIAPLVIKEVEIKEEEKEILSKLKIATDTSKEGLSATKEETSKKILESITKKLAQQKIEAEKLIAKELTVIPKEVKYKKLEPKNTQKVVIQKVVVKEAVVKKAQTSSKTKAISVSKDLKPDSYYFETQKATQTIEANDEDLPFVEKLGVVEVSDTYEVEFAIPD